ncbi:MAG: isocitrate lyase/phosphoenolpyruvate mutase family protein [Xanthomonadales bacterium]|nr:isocitrate lyase/phosphoenolpyruvate mutase family protein [Xanthomonadales bacterium]
MKFRSLHQQDSPLLLCNVWDTMSAQIAEDMGFQAIGTSSAAIAQSLGYEDGEKLPFQVLVQVVKNITRASHLPLTVDIESGYSRDPLEVVRHIKQLTELGIVGINIEDSVVSSGKRELINADSFAEFLTQITDNLNELEQDVFVNVRTDVFLLGLPDPLNHVKRRISLYQQANIDGIFVPCIVNNDDILSLTQFTDLPINVMCMPQLTDFNELSELGVKRISMGNFLFTDMYNHFKKSLSTIVKKQRFKDLFTDAS